MARKSNAAPVDEPVDSEPTAQDTGAELDSAVDTTETGGVDEQLDAAPETQPEPSWWEKAEGVTAFQGVTSEQDAIERVRTLERERAQYQQYSAHYAYQAQLQAQQAQARQQAEAAKTPEEPWWKKHYSPPEFNAAWRQEWLQNNPTTGVVEFKPDTPPDIRSKMLEHARFQREQREKFESNPYEYVYTGLADKIREEARAEAMQAVQGHQLQQQFYSLRNADSDWLFEQGDPSRPTQANYVFKQFLEPLIRSGLPLEQAWATAREQTALRFPPQATAQQVSQVNEQRKREFTNGAGPRPNRGNTLRGAANPAAPPQNGSLDLAAMLKADAESQGVNIYAPVGN